MGTGDDRKGNILKDSDFIVLISDICHCVLLSDAGFKALDWPALLNRVPYREI